MKALTLCCMLGYSLWVATYAVCAMMAQGITPLDLFGMCFIEFLVCLVVFCCGGVLVVSCLLVFYYLLSITFPQGRIGGEAVFVIGCGLIATGLGELRVYNIEGKEPLVYLFLWGFFCLPALYSVLCMRGWEWYERRRNRIGKHLT